MATIETAVVQQKSRLADLVQYVISTTSSTNPNIDTEIKQYKKDAKTLKAAVDLVHTGKKSLTVEETAVVKMYNDVLSTKYNELYDKVKSTYGVHSLEYKQFIEDVKVYRFTEVRDRNYDYSIKLSEEPRTSTLIRAYTTLPVADIRTVTSLAAKLNLVIIPVQYFIGYDKRDGDLADSYDKSRYNAGALSTLSYGTSAYSKVIRACKGNPASTWVVCPVQMLDVEYLVQDPTFRFYAPPQLSAALTTLRMMAPMLSQMQGQISNLETIQTQHSEMLRNHERRLGSHDEMIQSIRKTIRENEEREKQMRVEYQNMLQRQQTELNALRAVSMFDVDDPMLILVPEAITDINNFTGTCNIVGCWGPEFDPEKLKELGINTVFTGQANKANELTQKL